VEEGRNLTFTGSIGLRMERGDQEGETDDEADDDGGGARIRERIAAAVAHRNLFGSGRYLGLELVYGGDEREAFLTYREPFISRWNVPVQLQIFQSDDSTRPGTQFLQRGTSIEVTKVARLQTRWSLRYEYKISECRGGDLCRRIFEGEPVENIDESLLNIQISSISPTFFWDRRDDIIDPHRGFFTSASIEYAFPLFSADAGFLKEYLQGAFYIPLTERTVVALSGRLGLIQAYARYPESHDLAGQLLPIPLSERFTAGGETTHRAFALDLLGDLCYTEKGVPIRDCEPTLHAKFDPITGERLSKILPTGGSSMLLLNAEYRFPIFGPVGGAVFADIGNVYPGSRIDLGNLRYGAGLGFRYLSPVGPLRIDLAMPFEKRWYEDSFQYFISLGYAF
jgi:translocation and assembly module TamA